MSLANKVAIVTGGNSGIGKAIAIELGKQGASVVIDYVSHPGATEALEQEMVALGDRVIGVDADVSKLDDLQKLVASAIEKFGHVDIMVNKAGVETRTSILDTTEEQYEKVLEINLKSAFFGSQIAARQMIKQGGGGRIINITSIHEDWPMPGNTAYCLSKGGMRMLTRTAAVELAPHKILVVGVAPGAVATPINLSTMSNPALMAKLNAAIPLGRMAGVFMISTNIINIRIGMFPRWMSFLGFVCAVYLLLGAGRWGWSPLVMPIWIFVVSVYILIANLRTEPTVKAVV